MAEYVPRFYLYKMPVNSGVSFAQGTMQGFNQGREEQLKRMKALQEQEMLPIVKAQEQAKLDEANQKIAQQEEMFPYKKQQAQSAILHTNALINKINDDMSLTPYEKQLKISQAKQMLANSNYLNAQTEFMPTKYKLEEEGINAKQKALGNSPMIAFSRMLSSPQMQSMIATNPQVASDVAKTISLTANKSANNWVSNITSSDNPSSNIDSYLQQNNNIPINDNFIRNNLSEKIKQGDITENDIKSLQKNTADVLEKRKTTANILNQRQYANILDGLFQSGTELMPSVIKYAGIQGKGKKGLDAISSSFGKTSQEYADYLLFTRTVAPNAANEIRRTLGGQATDYEGKVMDSLANPTYWDSDPNMAMKQWNYLTNIYRSKVSPSLALGSSETVANLKKNSSEKSKNDPLGLGL